MAVAAAALVSIVLHSAVEALSFVATSSFTWSGSLCAIFSLQQAVITCIIVVVRFWHGVLSKEESATSSVSRT